MATTTLYTCGRATIKALTDHQILKLAAALGITSARIRAVLDDTGGSTTTEYALLFAGLALAVLGWLGAAELAVETVWHLAPIGDTTAPVLCAGSIRPTPTGGGC